MKKALLTLICLAAMLTASMSIKAQEVTIMLKPGWTWISYPSADTVDFATALGTFTPRAGDVIACEYDYSEYFGGEWLGGIQHFYPGYGYMYYSSRNMPVFLTFNAQQPSPQVVVTTSEPTLITAISAMGGGEVTVSDGTYIIAKGLCWAAHENPTTNDDFYQEAESGVGSFSISMTNLNIGTTYYVRAYAVTPNGTVYGDQKTFTTRDGIPILTTAEVTNIGSGWAYSGGDITDNGGLNVIARGLCWSTSSNPTIADSHTTDDYSSGTGNFTSWIMGLSASTIYYVRAYATTTIGVGYGEQKTFTTLDNALYIDLGLPSGLLWATCNVGADAPEEYGDYFAWGETEPKDYYGWSNYKYAHYDWDHESYKLTKYCNNPDYGYNGFTDDLTTLLPEDDAATANWGTDWRMPTYGEWGELLQNTTAIWISQNGVEGWLFTALNGNSLFLPNAGRRYEDILGFWYSYYWSSSLYTGNYYPHGQAWYFYFYYGEYYMTQYEDRCYGQTVRAVRSTSQNTSFVINAIANPAEGGMVTGQGNYNSDATCTLTATPNEGYVFINWTENGEVVSTNATYTFTVNADRILVANFTYNVGGDPYVDLGLPSGLLWATCNVGADVPENYGEYFAWGETLPKEIYNWSTYQYCNGSYNTLTKYCNISSCGYNGYIDNLITLLPEDDAATANWGNDWRIPTKEEWQELYNNTTVIWTTQNGVNGQLFTASNGNSLFLPAAGCHRDSSLYSAGSRGYYWSSSLLTYPGGAWYFAFNSDYYGMYDGYRTYGHSVRAVRSALQE